MAMNTNISEFQNLIYENAVISQGPPKVFRLVPKTQMIGTLSKRTLGEKKPNRENKTVLLVGETGAGKSTIINALFNFALGTKWKDNVWFEIIENQIPNRSQTSDVTVYELNKGEALDFSLTVIDTPGFGDTGGTEKDQLLTGRLQELFSSDDGVSEIHAVGLVLKASENRLSDRAAYIFNSVMSLFGKNMDKNIVALITHSDGRRPTNTLHVLDEAKLNCARNEKNEPVFFLFNNCQRDDRTEGTKYLELANETSMRSMDLFTEFLQKHKPAKLDMTKNVLKERLKLRNCMTNLHKQVQLITLKEKDIHQTQEALQKYELKMENNKNFNSEEMEKYKVKEPVDTFLFFFSGALCCKKCKENCHYPGCTWAQTPSQCEVFKDSKCTVCPGKCPAEDHVKENWRFVDKLKKVPKTNEEKKERYERNKTKRDESQQMLNKLQKEKADLEQAKNQFLDEAFDIIEKLDENALNVNAGSTFVHLDFLIEKMKEKEDTKKVQKLERIKGQMDEKNKAGAVYLK